MNSVIQTPRLLLRKLTQDDFLALQPIFQDMQTMYAWEHTFTNQELKEYIQNNINRYSTDGFSLFAVILKQTNTLIGVCGPLKLTIEGEYVTGLGYVFHKNYWGNGYAFEAANGTLNYCFESLNKNEITADIRPNNISSIKLIQKLGFIQTGEFVKIYKNKPMPHLIFKLKKADFYNLRQSKK